MRGLREQAELFAALDGLGAAGGAEFVEGAGAVGLDGVFRDVELGGDLAVAEALGDQVEDFEFAGGDAEALLAGGVGGEGPRGGGLGWDEHLDFARSVFLAAFIILVGGAVLAVSLAIGLNRGAVPRFLEDRRSHAEAPDERSLWSHL